MEINKPDDLGDIAHLGLNLGEAKLLLAALQQEIVAAQVMVHAVRRPECRCGGGPCHVKDYRGHAIATLFGQVTVRLPRFRCAACGAIEVGIDWPSHCRSTPGLDQLEAHLAALMTYRTAADVLEQMFPVGAGKDKETIRRHTLRAGAALRDLPRSGRKPQRRRSRSPWTPPSSGVARMANVTWRFGLATSKRKLVDVRFSALSSDPTRTSKC